MDAITSALDGPVAWTIVELLRRLRGAQIGLVMISHDLSLLPGTVDEVLVLADGRVVEHGPIAEVLDRQIETQILVDAARGQARRQGL